MKIKFINRLIKKGAIVIYEEIKDKYKPKLVNYIGVNADLLTNQAELKVTLDTLEKKAFKQAEVLLCVLNLLKTFFRCVSKLLTNNQNLLCVQLLELL